MGRFHFSWPLNTAGLLLIISIIYTLFRLSRLGAFNTVDKNWVGQYEIEARVVGPEALQMDHESEVLYFISSNPCTDNPDKGAIYNLDLTTGLLSELQQNSLNDFHPHGLSLLKQETGSYLFTNNHRQDGAHSVEVFKVIDENTMVHLKTVSSKLLTSPNDLVALNPDQFYVTIDGRAHDRTTRAWDTFFGRSTGSVLFFDGKSFLKVVDNLHFPNGIALNKHSNTVAVAETLSGNVVFYRMDDNSKLHYVDNYHIGVGIDNITFKFDGRKLYAALHQNLLQLSKHMKNVDNLSVSQVIEFDYQTKGLKYVFDDDGSLISGASSAVVHEDQMYIGAVCDDVLITIPLNR